MSLQRINIGDPDPLSLGVASHLIPERRAERIRASLLQWNRESPWRAFNRKISREEWKTPADSWIGGKR
jgi:hypothetical protein